MLSVLHWVGLAATASCLCSEGQSCCLVGPLSFLWGEVMLFLCLKPSFPGQERVDCCHRNLPLDSDPTRIIVSQSLSQILSG